MDIKFRGFLVNACLLGAALLIWFSLVGGFIVAVALLAAAGNTTNTGY